MTQPLSCAQVVLHIALSGDAPPRRCDGIELVASRHDAAAALLGELRMGVCAGTDRRQQAQLRARLASVTLRCGDATAAILDYSHVYAYDKLFGERVSTRLAAVINRSPAVRTFVSYQKPTHWRRRYGLRHFVHVASLQMRSTGGQTFTAYVSVRRERSGDGNDSSDVVVAAWQPTETRRELLPQLARARPAIAAEGPGRGRKRCCSCASTWPAAKKLCDGCGRRMCG